MATIRLNKTHRQNLENLVDTLVTSPETQKKIDETYTVARVEVISAIQKKYPKKDMDIFRKYNVGSYTSLVAFRIDEQYQTKNRSGLISFPLKETDVFYTPCHQYRTPIVLASLKLSKLLVDYETALGVHKTSVEEKRKPYYTLIHASTTFNQVLDVWPEAKQAYPTVNAGLPSTLTADVIEYIKQDSAKRMQQMEQHA